MVDRNKKAKDEFQAAQQRQAFARAVSSGEAGAYDNAGRRLEDDHLVTWNMPDDQFYWQIKVAPALDQPGPAMRVTLTLVTELIVRPGNIRSIHLAGKADADGHAHLYGEQQAAEPATDKPADGQPEGEKETDPDAPTGE